MNLAGATPRHSLLSGNWKTTRLSKSGLIRLGSGAITEARPLIFGQRRGALDRHQDRELRLDLEVPRVKLEAGPELRSALPETAHADGRAGRLKYVGQRG